MGADNKSLKYELRKPWSAPSYDVNLSTFSSRHYYYTLFSLSYIIMPILNFAIGELLC